MAYFGELRGEVSPRIRIAKGKPDFDRRLGSYNNSFNINVSRLKPVIKDGNKETMLAYSERMQNIAKTRKLQPAAAAAAAAVEDVSLEVRAHQIYKKNQPAEKLPPERKILSFEQLVGRSKNRKERPQSLDEVTLRKRRIRGVHGISKARTPRGLTVLPSLPDRPAAAAAAAVQKNVKVSFVNASDLYDFVDCSIRQTTFKKQPLGNLRREQDPFASDSERPGGAQFNAAHHSTIDARVLPPITIYLKPREEKGNKDTNKRGDKEQRTSDNVSQGDETSAPTSQLEQLKIRPRRAKRMTLPTSGLDSIPETDRDREASHLSSFRWASSQQPLYIPTHSSPDLATRGSGSPIRTANGSPSRTWSPTKSAMGSPKRTGSPMTVDSRSPTIMGSSRAEKYVKTERDIRVGLKVRPHSDPQTNVELDSDYEFDDDYGFYEDDSSSKVSEDSSNYVTRSLQKLVFLKDNSNNQPQQFT